MAVATRSSIVAATAAVAVVAPLLATAPPAAAGEPAVIVFNGEGNRLNAYEGDPGADGSFAKQTVIPSAADAPGEGRDINGQICSDPERPGRFVAGEDTGQTAGGGQGWGYFRLTGRRIGALGWDQLGKLEPTYVTETANPENYGCGFLSDGTLVTSDVGDQFPVQPATGQLILWFPPFDRSPASYCKIDIAIPTAGGIHVDAQDRVYVAASRDAPGAPLAGKRAGVYRYSGDWPTANDAAGGCGRRDPTGAPLVDDGRIAVERFIQNGVHLATPSAIAPSPTGGFYVSSVIDGKISEYDASGGFVREILAPPVTEAARPPYSTGTPYGLGAANDGTLYYADIGVTLGPPPGPGEETGSVRRIRFVDGAPQPPETIDDQLAFPDGIGLLELRR